MVLHDKLTLVQGPPRSGKTTLCLQEVRSSLAKGERVLFLAPTSASRAGLDPRVKSHPYFVFKAVPNLEDIPGVIREYVSSGANLIVLDDLEHCTTLHRGLASKAKFWTSYLPKLNQELQASKTRFMAFSRTPPDRAWTYASSLILNMPSDGREELTVVKSRTKSPDEVSTRELRFRFDPKAEVELEADEPPQHSLGSVVAAAALDVVVSRLGGSKTASLLAGATVGVGGSMMELTMGDIVEGRIRDAQSS